jgi:hypothetical protein
MNSDVATLSTPRLRRELFLGNPASSLAAENLYHRAPQTQLQARAQVIQQTRSSCRTLLNLRRSHGGPISANKHARKTPRLAFRTLIRRTDGYIRMPCPFRATDPSRNTRIPGIKVPGTRMLRLMGALLHRRLKFSEINSQNRGSRIKPPKSLGGRYSPVLRVGTGRRKEMPVTIPRDLFL